MHAVSSCHAVARSFVSWVMRWVPASLLLTAALGARAQAPFTVVQIKTPFTGSWADNALSVWADFDSDSSLDLATFGSDAGSDEQCGLRPRLAHRHKPQDS